MVSVFWSRPPVACPEIRIKIQPQFFFFSYLYSSISHSHVPASSSWSRIIWGKNTLLPSYHGMATWHCQVSNPCNAIYWEITEVQSESSLDKIFAHLNATLPLFVVAAQLHPWSHRAICELDWTLQTKTFFRFFFRFRILFLPKWSPGNPHSLSIIPPCTCLLSARPGHQDDREDQGGQEDPDHHRVFGSLFSGIPLSLDDLFWHNWCDLGVFDWVWYQVLRIQNRRSSKIEDL